MSDIKSNKVCTSGHDYVEKILTLSTCTVAGVKSFTCSKCGHVYTEHLPLLDHRYVNGKCTMCSKLKDE